MIMIYYYLYFLRNKIQIFNAVKHWYIAHYYRLKVEHIL